MRAFLQHTMVTKKSLAYILYHTFRGKQGDMEDVLESF